MRYGYYRPTSVIEQGISKKFQCHIKNSHFSLFFGWGGGCTDEGLLQFPMHKLQIIAVNAIWIYLDAFKEKCKAADNYDSFEHFSLLVRYL